MMILAGGLPGGSQAHPSLSFFGVQGLGLGYKKRG